MSHFAFLCIGPPEIEMGNVLHPADHPEMCLTERIEYRVGVENLSSTDKRSTMECFVSNRKSEYFENLRKIQNSQAKTK